MIDCEDLSGGPAFILHLVCNGDKGYFNYSGSCQGKYFTAHIDKIT